MDCGREYKKEATEILKAGGTMHIPEERYPPQSTSNDRATNGVIVRYSSSFLYECYNLQHRKFYN